MKVLYLLFLISMNFYLHAKCINEDEDCINSYTNIDLRFNHDGLAESDGDLFTGDHTLFSGTWNTQYDQPVRTHSYERGFLKQIKKFRLTSIPFDKCEKPPCGIRNLTIIHDNLTFKDYEYSQETILEDDKDGLRKVRYSATIIRYDPEGNIESSTRFISDNIEGTCFIEKTPGCF